MVVGLKERNVFGQSIASWSLYKFLCIKMRFSRVFQLNSLKLMQWAMCLWFVLSIFSYWLILSVGLLNECANRECMFYNLKLISKWVSVSTHETSYSMVDINVTRCRNSEDTLLEALKLVCKPQKKAHLELGLKLAPFNCCEKLLCKWCDVFRTGSIASRMFGII